MKFQSYKDLTVYQKAYQLTLNIYNVTERLSTEETYGLMSQMRKSASPCILHPKRRLHIFSLQYGTFGAETYRGF